MKGTEKGRTLILSALICTIIFAILGIQDAKSINAETPEETAKKQVKEITIVTVTPKKLEAKEYIDFDLRNLSIVRKEGEEDVVNNRGSREPTSVAEASGRDESDTQGYSDDNSGDEYSVGETDGSEMAESGQEQWSEPILERVESDPGGSGDGSEPEEGLTYLGTFTATAYCACPICTGIYSSGYTASGTWATEGRTIACNVLPFGTHVYIEGYGYYIVEDTGWSPYGDNWLDFFFESHDSALAFGLRQVEVYLVN